MRVLAGVKHTQMGAVEYDRFANVGQSAPDVQYWLTAAFGQSTQT